MGERRLVDLVYDGDIAGAITCAERFTPQSIHHQLFWDDERHLQNERPCDEFIRAWFASIESPFLRAEAGDWFTGTYTTELAPVPNGEYIGAYLRTVSLREVIQEIAERILGPELRDLEETPRHPLSAEEARKWRAIGKILAELDLPAAVSPIEPEEPETATD